MNKIYLYDFRSFIAHLDNYRNHGWVFFDTETLGFNPKYQQLLQIASLARRMPNFGGKIDWQKREQLNQEVVKEYSYNQKCRISALTIWLLRKQEEKIVAYENGETTDIPYPKYGKGGLSFKDILTMTNYFNSAVESHEDFSIKDLANGNKLQPEIDVIEQFENYLSSIPKVLLVGHNLRFDKKFVNVRSQRLLGRPFTRYDSIDTLDISRMYFLPTLKIVSALPDVAFDDKIRCDIILEKLNKYKSSTCPFSSRLGDLANVFDIDANGWHDALNDARMVLLVLSKMMNMVIDLHEKYGWNLLDSLIATRRKDWYQDRDKKAVAKFVFDESGTFKLDKWEKPIRSRLSRVSIKEYKRYKKLLRKAKRMAA